MTGRIDKRFWKNRRGNENRGGYYTFARGIKMPTHQEMDQLEKHNIVFDIDPEIRSVVIELNNKGYKTEGSCAGHVRVRRGFISFTGVITPPKVERISQIARKHGLKNIRINKGVPGAWWAITFSPVFIMGRKDVRKNLRSKFIG